jgi:hypothetical protein
MKKIPPRQLLLLLVIFPALLLGSCSERPTDYRKGVYMLLDTSGTYARELKKAQIIINYILADLNPGDVFAVARIDSASFSEKNIIHKATFDERPSVANNQKRAFAQAIDEHIKTVKPSAHTDISGALLQAVEYLNETGAGQKTVLVFSDLEEDLMKGHVRDFPIPLSGFDVVALNVSKLGGDQVDPRKYLSRLESWSEKVKMNGGNWRVINDLERLDHILVRGK